MVQDYKSLGRWYNESLSDKEQCRQVREGVVKGLNLFDKTPLPGRLKLWCFRFGLLPRLMWPLTVYEIPISEEMARVTAVSHVGGTIQSGNPEFTHL